MRAKYLVGCDGAHSTVRKGLGLTFEGGAFAESYMLGDVEVDWSMPSGYAIRASHVDGAGTTDDLLVCIPLPGHKRYRMSMLVPDDLLPDPPGPDGVAHGFRRARLPNSTTYKLCSIDCRPNPLRRRRCDGRRFFGSATASSTPTVAEEYSSPVMLPIFTHQPVLKDEHRNTGRTQPRLEAGTSSRQPRGAGSSRYLRHRKTSYR